MLLYVRYRAVDRAERVPLRAANNETNQCSLAVANITYRLVDGGGWYFNTDRRYARY